MKIKNFCKLHSIKKIYSDKFKKYECNFCKNEYAKKYREKNKDIIKEKNKKYNAIVRKKRQEWIKNDRIMNPDKYKKYAGNGYKKNRNEISIRKKLLKYKISMQEYNNLLILCNGVCTICKNPETRKTGKSDHITNLSIDHCHKTGKVRGLLCFTCNIGIGKFKEDIDLMLKAIEYLRKHNTMDGSNLENQHE